MCIELSSDVQSCLHHLTASKWKVFAPCLPVCGSDPDQWVARIYGNSWQQKRPNTFPGWLQPLETSGDSNKLCCHAGSAHMMGTQAGSGGQVIGACAQLKAVCLSILCSRTYPLHLAHICATTQACTRTTHDQACTHILFYSSALFFLSTYLSLFLLYLFLSLSHSFSRNLLFFHILSFSVCSQPKFWFSVSFYQP